MAEIPTSVDRLIGANYDDPWRRALGALAEVHLPVQPHSQQLGGMRQMLQRLDTSGVPRAQTETR